MTDTDLITAPAEQESAGSAGPDSGRPATKTRARTGLSGMVLSELRTVAGELGIKGTSGMRKGDLIAAIKERQGELEAQRDERILREETIDVTVPGPGRTLVKAEVPVDLPHPRDYRMKTSPEFNALKARLTEEIRAEAVLAAEEH